MGNRGIITLQDDTGAQHPVALYLHWNGGLESVLAFMVYTWNSYPRGHGDLFTFHARLCQVIGNFFPEGLSLYGLAATSAVADARGCDNGLFQFTLTKDGPRLTRTVGHRASVTEASELAAQVAAAKAHEYWTQPHSIFHQIHEHQPSRLTIREGRTLNPIMALDRLSGCWGQVNLTSTASNEERVAFITRITEAWNAHALPILQAHAAQMPPRQEAVA